MGKIKLIAEQLGAPDRHFAAAFGLAPCRQVTHDVRVIKS